MTVFITRALAFGSCAFMTIALAGCGPDYSPNTYNGSAVQQANKVDTGIVIGFRQVKISDDGTVGAVTGGAAGGILGAEFGSPAALTALGGTVVGGVVGSTVEHATGDTTGWEYIVREPKGDLVSVTQRQPTPIAIGQRVLVIEGKQARIVPDYATAADDTPSAPKAEEKHDQDKPAAANSDAATIASPSPSPAAAASPPVPAPDAASAAPAALSADQVQPPSAAPAPASPPPPAAAAPMPAASPPATAGGSTDSPPAPPS